MKKILILTGPQGSGNHMWSKIFALHPEVHGWQELLEEYWIGHDQEPFSDCWRNPENLRHFDWGDSQYHVTSISVPYMENGTPTMPDIPKFISISRDIGMECKLAVLGRDRNIVDMQEKRVRGSATFTRALEFYRDLEPDVFLSYELLHLYRTQYLKNIKQQLDFPISLDESGIDTILSEDANAKYFSPIQHHWVDDLAHHTSRKWK